MKKKILITGASGLVGQALRALVQTESFETYVLVRGAPKNEHEIRWNPQEKEIDLSRMEGFYAFINLSGENIAASRWSPEVKKKIQDSRVDSTRLLVEAIYHLKEKPSVLLNASATGFYGHREDELLEETAKPGRDFLSQVCIAWENEAMKAAPIGVRTCLMRFGVLLTPFGGALKKMLLPFKLGLGGPLGNGQQFMSWMDLDDVARGIVFLLKQESLSGAVNFVSPEAVTNEVFSKVLAKNLNRPCLLRAPAFALKLMLGEMSESLLLSSARVVPSKLLDAGFEFKYPSLDLSLKHCLSNQS